MSARITLHCNQMWRDGSCTAQLSTDARTIAEAREAASDRGWRTDPDFGLGLPGFAVNYRPAQGDQGGPGAHPA